MAPVPRRAEAVSVEAAVVLVARCSKEQLRRAVTVEPDRPEPAECAAFLARLVVDSARKSRG